MACSAGARTWFGPWCALTSQLWPPQWKLQLVLAPLCWSQIGEVDFKSMVKSKMECTCDACPSFNDDPDFCSEVETYKCIASVLRLGRTFQSLPSTLTWRRSLSRGSLSTISRTSASSCSGLARDNKPLEVSDTTSLIACPCRSTV